MNSLYGRFGINPESTTTVITDEKGLMERHYEKWGYYRVNTINQRQIPR